MDSEGGHVSTLVDQIAPALTFIIFINITIGITIIINIIINIIVKAMITDCYKSAW